MQSRQMTQKGWEKNRCSSPERIWDLGNNDCMIGCNNKILNRDV
jgi:hypothetical protein